MQMNHARAAVFAFVNICWGASLALAQAPAQPAVSNDLQRSVEIYSYNHAAKSGPVRGEVLYYYKCWPCHNDYTRAAGSPAASRTTPVGPPRRLPRSGIAGEFCAVALYQGLAGGRSSW